MSADERWGHCVSDAELWRRSSTGEPEAFGALFQRHDREIYNHAFRRTADWSTAEEVTSLVFLEAWRRRKSITLVHQSSLPWLIGIANNVLLNQWRSKKRHRRALERFERLRAPSTTGESVEDLDDRHRLEQVLRLVKRLPAEQREVLELVAWDGLDYESAALAAGVPVGTVRSRLSRARKRLSELERIHSGDFDFPVLGEILPTTASVPGTTRKRTTT